MSNCFKTSASILFFIIANGSMGISMFEYLQKPNK